MMRFKKGSVVEVLSKREVPSGSWFRAKIISGNGHYYNVKPDGGQAMEKVQRKDIRPCPPTIAGSISWVPGDIVEVFENNSWKPAKVTKALDGGIYFVVLLIGSSEELMLHKSNIRLWQTWKGNRWVFVDKESEILNEGNRVISPEVGKFNHRKLQRCAELKNPKGVGQFYINNDKHDDEPHQIYLGGSKKRSRFCLPKVETNTRAGAGRKIRAVKKEGKRQKLLVAHPSELPEKDQCWRPAKLASVGPRCWSYEQSFTMCYWYIPYSSHMALGVMNSPLRCAFGKSKYRVQSPEAGRAVFFCEAIIALG